MIVSFSGVEVESQAIAHEAVSKFLQGRQPKRVIVVPGRLVNVAG